MRLGLSAYTGTTSNGQIMDVLGRRFAVGTSTGLIDCVVGINCTLEEFVVRVATAPGVGSTRTWTAILNGVSTGNTVTISGTNTTATFGGSFFGSLSPGDRVRVLEGSSGSPAGSTAKIAYEINATTPGEHFFASNIGLVSTGNTKYFSPFEPGTINNAVNNAKTPVAVATTMTGIRLASHLGALTAGNGIVCVVYVSTDGGTTFVAQDGTGGTPNTTTQLDNVATNGSVASSFSLSLSRGDIVYVQLTTIGSLGGGQWFSAACVFTNASGFANIASPPMTPSAGATLYGVAENGIGSNGTTETFAFQNFIGTTGYTLRDPIYFIPVSPPGAAKTITLDYRRNNGTTSIGSCVLSGTTSPQTASNTGSQSYASGDTFGVRWTVSGTPTVTLSRFACIYEDDTFVVPPTGVPDTYTTPYNTPLSVSALAGVLANDTGDPTTATLVDDVTNGTLTLNADGSFDYTPDYGFTGDDTFTYMASNSAGDDPDGPTLVTITVGEPEVPSGGGETPAGLNPVLGAIPTHPLMFVEIYIGGTWYVFAETGLPDAAAYYHGPKVGTLMSVTDIHYQATHGESGLKGVPFQVRVFDGDRVLHELLGDGSTAARNGYISVYWIDDAVRRAEGVAKRIGMGQIRSYVSDEYEMEFSVNDVLSIKFARASRVASLPPEKLLIDDFEGMDPSRDGTALPICIGRLTDHDQPTPQGVVPPLFLGYFNPSVVLGASSNFDVDIWLVSQGAFPTDGGATGFWQTWYNTLTDTNVRVLVPESEYGVNLWAPGKPGWVAVSNTTDPFIDYPFPVGAATRRYTPLLVRRSLPEAEAARNGQTLIAINCFGIDDESDGTGNYLDSPPRIVEWILNNMVWHHYRTGAFENIPLFPWGYSYIDTVTLEAVHDALSARVDGYPIGMILGLDGQFQTLDDVLGEIASGAWIDFGINLDGQFIMSFYDPLEPAVLRYDAQTDIVEGTYKVTLNDSRYANQLHQQYAKYFVAPYAPAPTPAEGEPAVTRPVLDYPPYQSGVVEYNDFTAQAAVDDEVVTFNQESNVVRDPDVAVDMAGRILAEMVGPQYDGPHEFTFQTGPQGLGRGSTHLNVFSVIEVSHPTKLGSTAYVDRCRIMEMTIHCNDRLVSFAGDVLSHTETL